MLACIFCVFCPRVLIAVSIAWPNRLEAFANRISVALRPQTFEALAQTQAMLDVHGWKEHTRSANLWYRIRALGPVRRRAINRIIHAKTSALELTDN